MKILAVVYFWLANFSACLLPGETVYSKETRFLMEFLMAYMDHYKMSSVHVIAANGTSADIKVFWNVLKHRHFVYSGVHLYSELYNITERSAEILELWTQKSKDLVFITNISVLLYNQKLAKWIASTASRLYFWLLYGTEQEIAASHLSDLYFPLDNKITFAIMPNELNSSGTASMQISEIYQANITLQQNTQKIGIWTYNLKKNQTLDYFTYFPSQDASSRRENMSGVHLRCATEHWPPSTNNSVINGSLQIGGYIGHLFETMRNTLNFTYSCKKSVDGSFGTLENGTWTGLIKMLLDNEVDIAVAQIDNTAERSQVVDFIVPVEQSATKMVFKKPEPNYLSTFTRQFAKESWVAYILTILFAPFLFYVIRKYSPYEQSLGLSDAWFDIYGLIFNQGEFDTKSIPGRIYLIFIAAFSIIMITSYTSDLVSALSVPTIRLPFIDLSGFVENGGYEMGVTKGNSEAQRLSMSQDPVYKRAWKSAQNNLLTSETEAIRRVKSEKFVILVDNIYYDHYYSPDCSLTTLPYNVFEIGTGIAVRKNSPYKDVLNSQMLGMRTTGIVMRTKKMYITPKIMCLTTSTEALNFLTLSTVFVLLLLCAGVSLIALFFEKLVFAKTKNKSVLPVKRKRDIYETWYITSVLQQE